MTNHKHAHSTTRRIALAAGFAIAAAAPAHADCPPGLFDHSAIPLGAPDPSDSSGIFNDVIVVGTDIDGNGVADLVVFADGRLRVFRNTGDAVPMLEPNDNLPFSSLSYDDHAILDVDGDGDDEIAVLESDECVTIYGVNDFDGNFSGQSLDDLFFADFDFLPFIPSRLVAGDVDNDGDDDLLIVAASDETVSFSEPDDTFIKTIFLRNTNGTFAAASSIPRVFLQYDSPRAFDNIEAVLTDLDGDDQVDLFVSANRVIGVDPVATTLAYIGIGDRTGEFDRLPLPYPLSFGVLDVTLADVDADGEQDIPLAGDLGNDNSSPRAIINEADGTFQFARFLGDFPDGTKYIDMVDVDDDGDPDAVHTTTDETIITFNDGGFFSNSRTILEDVRNDFTPINSDYPTDLAVYDSDFTGDGLPDIAYVERGTKPAAIVLENRGDATYGPKQQSLPDIETVNDVAVGDFNLDGINDFVAVGRGERVGFATGLFVAAKGNGDGTFDIQTFNTDDDATRVLLADLNGDGTLDAVTASEAGGVTRISAWRANPGDFGGGFSSSRKDDLLLTGSPIDLAVGDADADGDLDIFYAVQFDTVTRTSVWFNEGNGTFNRTRPTLTRTDAAQSIAAGDMDNDGDADLLLVLEDSEGDGVIEIISGEPMDATRTIATIGDEPLSAVNSIKSNLALTDADSDGDLDIFFTPNSDGVALYRLLNQGDGSDFILGVLAYSADDPTGTSVESGDRVIVDDIDDDGDSDILVLNSKRDTFTYVERLPGQIYTPTAKFFYVGPGAVSFATGDVTGDGNTDVIAASSLSGTVVITENQSGCVETPLCPGDTDQTGDVNAADLLTVLSNFGSETAPGFDGDVSPPDDPDGNVNAADLLAVLANVGNVCV